MGAAYRASGRTRPIFDTFGHHPYPTRSNERPWVAHSDEAIVSLGDVDRLIERLREAFVGTAQATPDSGLPIWYLETGYQTLIDDNKQSLYDGVENWPGRGRTSPRRSLRRGRPTTARRPTRRPSSPTACG